MKNVIQERTASKCRAAEPAVSFPPQRLPMREGSRRERRLARLRHFGQIAGIGLRHFRNPWKVWRAIRILDRGRRQLYGDGPPVKGAKVGDRFFWDPTAPGFPSRAMTECYRRLLNSVFPFMEHPGLRMVYFSITKQCSLRCRHCYEWEQLHRPEQLSREDLIGIVRKFQDYGTGVFYLEGGEPLQRLDDLLALLDHADDRSDFWIISSGLGLTAEKAARLRQHGLTGVAVSLDHWDASPHNDFRGHPQAFAWAVRAVVNANQAGLVTSLSLCATREMTRPENLRKYMDLARRLGVSFVQWLEPRAVGRFAGQDVALNPAQQQRLEAALLTYNLDPRYGDYPLVFYPAYLQRKAGCPGAGQSFLYIDSNGDVNPCPFCQQAAGSALKLPVSDLVSLVRQSGCGKFPPMRVNGRRRLRTETLSNGKARRKRATVNKS